MAGLVLEESESRVREASEFFQNGGHLLVFGPAAARRYKNYSGKCRPPDVVKVSVWFDVSCLCGKVPLVKFYYERWACCGFAGWIPWRLGLGWLINHGNVVHLLNVWKRCFWVAWRNLSNACRGHGEGRGK